MKLGGAAPVAIVRRSRDTTSREESTGEKKNKPNNNEERDDWSNTLGISAAGSKPEAERDTQRPHDRECCSTANSPLSGRRRKMRAACLIIFHSDERVSQATVVESDKEPDGHSDDEFDLRRPVNRLSQRAIEPDTPIVRRQEVTWRGTLIDIGRSWRQLLLGTAAILGLAGSGMQGAACISISGSSEARFGVALNVAAGLLVGAAVSGGRGQSVMRIVAGLMIGAVAFFGTEVLAVAAVASYCGIG